MFGRETVRLGIETFARAETMGWKCLSVCRRPGTHTTVGFVSADASMIDMNNFTYAHMNTVSYLQVREYGCNVS